MRAIYWKELRELAVLGLPYLGFAIYTGLFHKIGRYLFGNLLGWALVAGVIRGAAQGLLDRARRDDAFLLHRPVSALRLHGARTLAGITVALVPVLVFLLLHWTVPRFVEPGYWMVMEEPHIHRLGAGQAAAAVVAVLGCWSVVRYALGRRTWAGALVALVVLLLTTVGLVLRHESIALPAGMFAVVFTAGALLDLARRRVRWVTLLIVGVVALEGHLWLRSAVTEALIDSYPYAAIDKHGRVTLWDWARHTPVDANHSPVTAEIEARDIRGTGFHVRLPDLVRKPPRSGPGDPVAALNRAETFRMQWRDERRVLWEARGGQLVGVNRDDGSVLAELGRVSTFRALPPSSDGALLLVEEDRALYLVGFDAATRSVRVERKPIPRSHEEIDPGPGASVHHWVALPGEVCIVDRTGRALALFPMDANEEIWQTSRALTGHPQWDRRFVYSMMSIVPPVHPTGCMMRVRVVPSGEVPLAADIEMTPRNATELAYANLLGAIAALRPLPLNVAAWVSDPPRSFREMVTWWWRDPFLARKRYAGWLFVSCVLALACGWFARRSARMRCATASAVRFWTASAFLLGPLGLVWMWLSVPRVAVERVNGRRRAVNLDEPWPEPRSVGTEVLV